MNNSPSFSPTWSSPPGETIADILHDREISLSTFASQMGLSIASTKALLKGKEVISGGVATSLAEVLGSTEEFWLKRDSIFRADSAVAAKRRQDDVDWLAKIPVGDMIKNGWVAPNSTTKADKLSACLKFFQVNNTEEWYENYGNLLQGTAFRISSSFDSTPESVVTWLQQGIVDANSGTQCLWNKNIFRESLNDVRSLTRIKTPSVFIPQVQELFKKCGVTLSIVKTPRKCHASGATLSLKNGKKLMILSFRHLTDDHFWFSLFHEAGHLLLHESENFFLEGMKSTTVEEDEANDFAYQILIPRKHQNELLTLNPKEWKKIVRFAKNIGISTGIVVGQLQHRGLVRHNQLNKLKTRFSWSATP